MSKRDSSRNMFEMMITPKFKPRFEHAFQLELLEIVYFIEKVFLYRGFPKTYTVYRIWNTVPEANFLAKRTIRWSELGENNMRSTSFTH